MNQLLDVIKEVTTDVVNSITPDIAILGTVLQENPLRIQLINQNNIILKDDMLLFSYFIKPNHIKMDNTSTFSTLNINTFSSNSSGKPLHSHSININNQMAYYNIELKKNMTLLLLKINDGKQYIVMMPVFPNE